MPTLICRHIKTNGARCGVPALRGQVLCYFHNNSRRRHQSLSPFHDDPAILHPISADHRDKAQREPIYAEHYGLHPKCGPVELDFPPLEDRESIQLALSMVICALAQNRIDSKRAQPLIYALQVASTNARDLRHSPGRSNATLETVAQPDGAEIALDEDSRSEIDYQAFLKAYAAEEAAAALAAEMGYTGEDDDDDDDDDGDSAAIRYLRKRLTDAL